MSVAGVGAGTSAAASAVEAADGCDGQSIAMLRNALDGEAAMVDKLMQSLETGAGQILDIRA